MYLFSTDEFGFLNRIILSGTLTDSLEDFLRLQRLYLQDILSELDPNSDKYRLVQQIQNFGWDQIPLGINLFQFPRSAVLRLPLNPNQTQFIEIPIRARTFGELIQQILKFYEPIRNHLSDQYWMNDLRQTTPGVYTLILGS